ncbi:NAD(P)H-dependent oxidoreductase, partial [Streptomyces xanthochromogenes]
MATLLHIDSSAFPVEASTSRAVTEAFRRAWLEEHPGGQVIYRDLAVEPVPHITADAHSAGLLDPAEHTEEQARAFAERLVLIAELEAA